VDTEGLLRSLSAHNVRYVIIGATAFATRARPSTSTSSSRPTPENAERTRAALAAFGYDLTNVSAEDEAQASVSLWRIKVRGPCSSRTGRTRHGR
jgi:hypothetical protein